MADSTSSIDNNDEGRTKDDSSLSTNRMMIPKEDVLQLIKQEHDEMEQKMKEMEQTMKEEHEKVERKMEEKMKNEMQKTKEEYEVRKEELLSAIMSRQIKNATADQAAVERNTTTMGGMIPTDRLEETESDSDDANNKLPEDTYSLILCYDRTTLAFWLGVVVFSIQTTLFLLVGSNQLGGTKNNWFEIPENVDMNVRVTQFLAIIIAIVFQDDFVIFVERVREGYHIGLSQAEAFSTISYGKWIFSNTLRAIQGFLGLIVALLLIVQSDYVFDLLLNFTGLVFLSQLDDLVFRLVKRGFFGDTLEVHANLVADTKYTIQDSRAASKRAHARFLIIAGSIVYIGFFTIFFMQRRGRFMCESIYIEFSDPELPFLETYAGIYTFTDKKRDRQRLCVEDRGEGIMAQKGRFAFCRSESIWAFSIEGSTGGGDDPCENYLASTPADSSFDLLGTDSQTWVKANGDPIERTQLICASDKSSQQQQECGTSSDCGRTCRVLRYKGTNILSSPIGWDDDFDILNDGDAKAYDHPVFMRERNATEYSFDLLVFTGIRWVVAESNNTREELVVLFGPSNNFHASQLEPSSIMLLSEAVDPFTDPFTPQGLSWYHANYYANAHSGQEFPVTDFQRPVDVEFSCRTCDNKTNPCRHGDCQLDGVCDCRYRTDGDLCEIEPLGDGVCDEFFNNEAYQYDGGDCCGSTCQGFFCLDYWTFRDFEFAGFPNCKDPETVPLSIHFDLSVGKADSWSLVCDGISYIAASPKERYALEETISWVRVKDGSNCTVVFKSGYDYGTEIFLRNGTKLEQRFNNSQTEFVVVSTCLLEEIVKYFPGIDLDLLGYDDYIEGEAVNSLNKYILEDLTCGNPLFKQQYAMAVLSAHGWLPPLRHCQWDRNLIYCENGAVVEISLSTILYNDVILSITSDIFVDGAMPSEIGLLTDLEMLDLSWNFLTGSLPSEFGMLTNLVTLFLETNDFTGSLPSELGMLANLEEKLDLEENLFTGSLPSELGMLNKLWQLDLSYNYFTGSLPSELGMLTKLDSLYLSSNSFTGNIPSELGMLTYWLYNINLSNNHFSGSLPSELFLVRGLKSLYLSSNNLSGNIPSELGMIKFFRGELDLSNNNFTGSLPSELGMLTNMYYLNLSNNNFNGNIPSELGMLTSLEFLHLSNNKGLDTTNIPPEVIMLCNNETRITCYF